MELEFRWWGFIAHLNREVGCWVAASHPEAEKYLDAIPEPWRTFVKVAIAVHKWGFNQRMGADGLDMHFNWGGFCHWIGPIGNLQRC
ncbi:hypothetical protein [Streptomyces sviceus]|uniref:hypothetical protein n=1 Tax=Streptomyces sviceus TaxID=285530 RepID=UPI00367A52C6